ncbi:hypothetical protein [Parapedobacter tibetensis]|uniref:hypothetical protein n=1 Tax=Parapedobacter tibetensis TaxID=2972951 RepID=UPI00214DAD11|nr:hypothetical protein [Parapedobacter tibetensis]
MVTKKILILIAIMGSFSKLAAQSETPAQPAFSIEARITNFFQRGYDFKVFYYPSNNLMSYGVSITGQRITGTGKGLVFDGENLDQVDTRLSWVASLLARRHFSSDYKGFFAEFSGGIEQFRVSYQQTEQRDLNGFLSPCIGYLWFPLKENHFYIMPKVAVNFLIFRPDRQVVGPATYRLRSVHPSPSVTVGWKF